MARSKKRSSEEFEQEFELLFPLLVTLLFETQELSKKKPNDPLNLFKVKAINKVLARIVELLNGQSVAEFIHVLDEDMLPTNSDAVIIMVQFKSAMEQFKRTNRVYDKSRSRQQWIGI